LDFPEITPSRCRARNCRHGFYYDPMTFDAKGTLAEADHAVFVDSESPEKGDADGVDEVSSVPCLSTMADHKPPSSVNYLSSFCLPFIN
jgi:hypothetical protein